MNLIYLHIGDYCQATARLTPEQDGIYLRLLTEYYKTEKAPVDDFSKLAFLTGCNTKKYQTDLRFVLEHFFVYEPDQKCWLHKRVEREIASYKVDGVQKRYAILCRHWEKVNPGVKKPSYEEFSTEPSRYYDETTGRLRIVTGRKHLVLEPYGDGSTDKPAPNYPPGTSTQEPGTSTQEPGSTPVVPKGTPTIESLAESIYALYPRKQGKTKALAAIVKVLQGGKITELELQRIVKLYAEATAKWPEQDRTFIPHPATWFNRGSYMDDPTTWTRQPAPAEKKGRGAGAAAELVFDDAPRADDGAPPDWRLLWSDVFSGPCPELWADVPGTCQRRLRAEIAKKSEGGAGN